MRCHSHVQRHYSTPATARHLGPALIVLLLTMALLIAGCPAPTESTEGSSWPGSVLGPNLSAREWISGMVAFSPIYPLRSGADQLRWYFGIICTKF